MGRRLFFQPIHQPFVRIEPDYVYRIGHEVGKRIHVVIYNLTGTVVNHILNAAHVDAGVLHDGFDRGDHVLRRRVAFHFQSVFWGIQRTGVAHQFLAVVRLADVGRTKVERLAAGINLNGIEVFAAQRFYPCDVAAPRRDEFLNQRRLVDSKIKRTGIDVIL